MYYVLANCITKIHEETNKPTHICMLICRVGVDIAYSNKENSEVDIFYKSITVCFVFPVVKIV